MDQRIGIVFTAEFMRRMRSRLYVVGTLIGLLGIGALFLLPSILEHATGGTGKAIVLAGPPELRASARTLLERDGGFTVSAEVDTLPDPVTLAFLETHGRAAAAIRVSPAAHGLRATAFARDPGGFAANQAGRALIPLNLALGTGLPSARLAVLARNPLEVRGVETRYDTEAKADLARAVAMGLVFILYFAIIYNSQAITSSVAEEKTSRVAELLVATIPPSSLLAGKVLGTGATGLIQLAIWLGAGVLFSQPGVHALLNGGDPGGPTDITIALSGALTAPEMFAFVAFFLIGYFQFAMLFAAAGSLVTRTEDLGSISGPLMIPIVLAFFIAQYALVTPNGTFAVVASIIPLLSPFVMFTRVVITDVPAWQTALSIVLNLAALVAIVPVAGKIYRVGMLLYGRTPKLSQVWKVLRS